MEAVYYGAASAVALGIDFGTYLGLIYLLDIPYRIAAPIGFMLGMLAIYLLSISFVFKKRSVKSRTKELTLFVGIGITGLLLNSVFLYLCVDRFSLSFELSKLASAAVIFCFSFITRKFVLFS